MTLHSRTSDLIRQWVVFVSLIVAVVGSLIGSGALGGIPIQEAAGGALRADATLIAPAVPAFSIWSVIYLGLAGLAIWQLLPAQRANPRQRQLGGAVGPAADLRVQPQAGGLLEQLVHEIEIHCRPADLPEKLINDVEGLELGQTLKVSDLNLPKGVTVKMDGDVLVAIVNQTRASVSQSNAS